MNKTSSYFLNHPGTPETVCIDTTRITTVGIVFMTWILSTSEMDLLFLFVVVDIEYDFMGLQCITFMAFGCMSCSDTITCSSKYENASST